MESVRNAVDFASTALWRFENGDESIRRRVADRLGTDFYLTLGKLEIRVHPLLVPFLTVGPGETGSGQLKRTQLGQLNPSWSAIRDYVRCLSLGATPISKPSEDFGVDEGVAY